MINRNRLTSDDIFNIKKVLKKSKNASDAASYLGLSRQLFRKKLMDVGLRVRCKLVIEKIR